MPNSNERVIAVGGDDETKIVSALDMILSLLSTSPRQHQTSQYDPGSVGKPSFGTVGNTSNIAFGSGSMSGVGSGILGQGISANVAVTHLEVSVFAIDDILNCAILREETTKYIKMLTCRVSFYFVLVSS